MDVALVCDLGRLSVRFGLVSPGSTVPRSVERLSTADHATFTDALVGYLKRAGLQGQVVPSALAVAGAIQGDSINLTGSRWYISLAGVGAVLRARPLAFNECAASALALTRLGPTDFQSLPGPPAHPPRPDGNYLVLAPATGLGVSALVSHGGRLLPIASEAAHMTFAATTPVERRIVEHLVARGVTPSNESLLSARGLVAAYAALGGTAVRSEEVTAAAARNPRAAEAIDAFVGALGSVIGDLALTFGAWNGVYLTGAIARALRSRLAQPAFRARLEAKGAFRRQLSALPVAVVQRGDLELIGAATALAEEPSATNS